MAIPTSIKLADLFGQAKQHVQRHDDETQITQKRMKGFFGTDYAPTPEFTDRTARDKLRLLEQYIGVEGESDVLVRGVVIAHWTSGLGMSSDTATFRRSTLQQHRENGSIIWCDCLDKTARFCFTGPIADFPLRGEFELIGDVASHIGSNKNAKSRGQFPYTVMERVRKYDQRLVDLMRQAL
jgi:hypothetical protein